MQSFALPFILCLISILVSRKGKLAGSSLAFFGGWLFYAASWLPAPFAPICIINALGHSRLIAPDLWAISDCIVATYIFTDAFEEFSGTCLFALFFTENIIHVIFIANGLHYPRYKFILDGLFYAQVSVFLVTGWPRIYNYVGKSWSSARRNKHSFLDIVAPASPKDSETF